MNDLFTHVSTTGFNSEGYDSANNVKHGEMEDAFMNFATGNGSTGCVIHWIDSC